MAEAAVEHPASRFFCHLCAQEVRPVLPEYTCSRCHSGFIEELAQPQLDPSREEDLQTRAFEQITDAILQSFPHDSAPGPRGHTRITFAHPGSSPRRQVRVEHRNSRPPEQFPDPLNRAGGFLQNFIQSLTGTTGFGPNANFPVFVNLPGNPGDYVWGRGGWNAIISQLINQLDGTGPPPLPKEKINEIPIVQISQTHVDQNLQCTVCMEDFVLEEPVRLLPCQHHYHENCIIPWLELHGTCPICRKLLMNESAQNASTNESSNAGPSNEPSTSQSGPNSNVPNTATVPSLFSDSLYDFNEDWE